MKVFDGHPLDQIFTHVDPEGVTRHFNASALLRAIMRKQIQPLPQFIELGLDEGLVDYIEKNQGVEQDHVERISEASTNNPILMVEFKDDGTHVIIDGSHRVVKRWRMGKHSIPCILVKEPGWVPFLVTDMNEVFPLDIAIPFLDKVSARLKKV